MATSAREAMRGLVGEATPGLTGVLDSIFGDMPVAEEEVAAGEQRHPMEADLVHASYRWMRRTRYIRTDALYRVHCREIADRAAVRGDMSVATDAEMLGVLMELSLMAPLNQDAGALYHRLFKRQFPEQADTLFTEHHPELRGSHATAVEELDDHIRRRIGRDADVVEARGQGRRRRG